jgi:TM2 domain-containing membrane protein YozV/Tfp pilus assembly protein PilE
MDVFLLAAPQPGVERASLVSNLAAAFKKDVPSIEKMLRRSRTLIKADVGHELAAKYKALIEKSGGQCELAIHGQAPAPLPGESPKAHNMVLEPLVNAIADTQKSDHSDAIGYCIKCGTAIRTGELKCSTCFTPITTSTSKNKTTAGFLALFFGGLGVHRLYLGQWWGVIYLLFWGTLIPSIVSIVEAVIFWSTSKERWDEKYGNVPKNSGVMAAVFIVSIFFFIALTGILAAVALPAYQDYTNRAKIQSAMPLVSDAREKVERFIKRTQSFPTDNIIVGLADNISNDVIESITLQDHAKLEVAYRLPSLKDKNTIIWTPIENNGHIVWSCKEGSMQDKYRPRDCRSEK